MIGKIKDKEEFYKTVKNRIHNINPKIREGVYVADNAVVIGEVSIDEGSSVWFNCLIRGDVNDIKIGKRTNIQDATVVHVSSTLQGTYIGDDVTIGHGALIHACTIDNGAFIGMQACIMDGAHVEAGAMVAAGALVSPRKTIPSGELWGGTPARYMRDLTPEEKQNITSSAEHYVRLSQIYLQKP